MKIDYLYYFKRLAETLNYSRAAKDLYVAQPTLSVAIKRMEEELDLALFEHMGRSKIILTPAGIAFYEYVSQALGSFERGLKIAREKQGDIGNLVRVGTIFPMQGGELSRSITQFHAESDSDPDIQITKGYTPELMETLRRGQLDVLFASKISDDDTRLKYSLCFTQPLCVAVNRTNPLSKQSSVSLDDLVGLGTIYTYHDENPAAHEITDLVEKRKIKLARQFDDEITIASLIASNRTAIGLCCYSFLLKAFDDVVCLPVDEAPDDFHKVYLISRNETQMRIVQSFIDFMETYRFRGVAIPR